MFFHNTTSSGFPPGFPPNFAPEFLPHNSSNCINNTEFYKILHVDKKASQKDIKKAYRKLALKHHPDKGGKEDQFQKICNAYEILSDPEKRDIYDKYGEEGLKNETFSNSNDIFNMFYYFLFRLNASPRALLLLISPTISCSV